MSDTGRFVWYDLFTTEKDAAVSFYTKVIGWGTELWKGGPEPYTMFKTDAVSIGGVVGLPAEATAKGATPHWMAYVGVANVDETLETAVGLEASVVHAAQDIPSVGRFAVLGDPQGAVIAVFTSARQMPGVSGPPGPGIVSWHELATTDYEAALGFYEKLFGWQKTEAMDMGEMGTYQMFGNEGTSVGGMFNKPADMPGPPAWLYYTMVQDLHAAIETVKENGGQVINGPMDVPGGDHIAQCKDPQGGMFALHAHKS